MLRYAEVLEAERLCSPEFYDEGNWYLVQTQEGVTPFNPAILFCNRSIELTIPMPRRRIRAQSKDNNLLIPSAKKSNVHYIDVAIFVIRLTAGFYDELYVHDAPVVA